MGRTTPPCGQGAILRSGRAFSIAAITGSRAISASLRRIVTNPPPSRGARGGGGAGGGRGGPRQEPPAPPPFCGGAGEVDPPPGVVPAPAARKHASLVDP